MSMTARSLFHTCRYPRSAAPPSIRFPTADTASKDFDAKIGSFGKVALTNLAKRRNAIPFSPSERLHFKIRTTAERTNCQLKHLSPETVHAWLQEVQVRDRAGLLPGERHLILEDCRCQYIRQLRPLCFNCVIDSIPPCGVHLRSKLTESILYRCRFPPVQRNIAHTCFAR
jgi:hypothetical protein